MALFLISITSALAAISTPLTNLFNAIGKISITFKLMIMWTSLTYLFIPFLSFLYGVNGAALGFMIVGITSFIPMIIAKKYFEINFFQIVTKPFIAAVIMGIVVYLISKSLPTSIYQVIFMVITGLILYTVLMIILEPSLRKIMQRILRTNK